MKYFKKTSTVLFTILALGAASAFAESITLPQNSVSVPNEPNTGAAGVSVVLSGSVSDADTLSFEAKGIAYLQNSKNDDTGTPQYGANAAGVIIVAGQPGYPSGDTVGNAVFYGSADFGALVVSLDGGNPVQVFPANTKNGLGSSKPTETLNFNATLSSLFGNFGTINNPKLTFVVYDSGYNNNSGSFELLAVAAPPPSISSLQPNSLDAGSEAFTLTVNGAHFASGDTVEWNGVALATTFVSASKLTAKVSTADVEEAGSAAVRVVDTAAKNAASEPAIFAIPLTSFIISAQTIKSVSGKYTIALTLKNSGHKSATNISLTGAYLATSEATTALPIDITSIAAGGTKSVTLSFPSDAGKPGEDEYLKLYGSYVGGSVSLSSSETIP